MQGRRLAIAIFGLALLVRIANVADLAGNPFFQHPVIDAAEYDEWARAIRAGDLLSSAKGAFWQAPLYPYFLAAVYFFVDGSYLVARLVQAALGAGSAMLVFLVGARVFGRRVGAIAGFGAALYWPFIFFDSELLPVVLVILLDLLAAWLLLRAAEAPRGRLGPWLAAGAVMGLGAWTRATSLLLVPLVVAWMWWSLRARLGTRHVAIAAACLAGTVVVMVGAVTLRNQLVGGQAPVVASSGGLNFYIGNNADYDRTVAIRPGARWSALLLEGPTHPGVTEVERSRFFTRRSLDWMARHPGDALALYVKKTYLFWNRHEIRRNQDPYFFRQYTHFAGPPFLGFAAVGPLALVGLVVGRKPWDRALLLHLLLLGQFVSVILFFVVERYRLPAVPYLLIFAACAAAWLIDHVRARRWKPFAIGVACWGAALAVSLSDAYGTAHPMFAREYYELGLVAEKAGRHEEAAGWHRRAIEADAADPDFHVHLAIAEMGLRRYEAAEAALAEAIRLMPGCGDAWYLVGGIAQDRQEFARAEDAYRKAMQYSPMGVNADVYGRLAAVVFEQGPARDADALAAVREALARDPSLPEAHVIRALVAERGGRRDEAIAEVQAVLRARPDHRGARAVLERMLRDAKEAGEGR